MKVQYSLRAALLAVAGLSFAMFVVAHLDCLYSRQIVYGIDLRIKGVSDRAALVAVRQHALFRNLNRIQLVFFLDRTPTVTARQEPRELQQSVVGHYVWIRSGDAWNLRIPGVQMSNGVAWAVTLRDHDYRHGCVLDVYDISAGAQDTSESLIHHPFALADRRAAAPDRWSELVSFCNDPMVASWTGEDFDKWRAHR